MKENKEIKRISPEELDDSILAHVPGGTEHTFNIDFGDDSSDAQTEKVFCHKCQRHFFVSVTDYTRVCPNCHLPLYKQNV